MIIQDKLKISAAFLFFLFFLGQMLIAQNRVIYQLDFKPSIADSLYQSEMYNLDIIGEKSVFYAKDLHKMDSAIINSPKITFNFPEPKNEYWVYKNTASGELKFRETIGMHSIKVTSKWKPNWVIQPETKMQGKYTLHKALLDFRGRKWTAWFAPSVPITDGPYKFYGLPGLIFEMYDEKQEYTFHLLEIKDFKAELFEPTMYAKVGISTLELDAAKYGKLKNLYEHHPEALFQNMNSEFGVHYPPEVISGLTKALLRLKERKNNPIELE